MKSKFKIGDLVELLQDLDIIFIGGESRIVASGSIFIVTGIVPTKNHPFSNYSYVLFEQSTSEFTLNWEPKYAERHFQNV